MWERASACERSKIFSVGGFVRGWKTALTIRHHVTLSMTLVAGNLEQLLAAGELWRGGDQHKQPAYKVVSSGYPELDRHLPGGGWPQHTMIEVLSAVVGMGELRLFMPALVHLASTHAGAIAWVAPPYLPYAPAFTQWGIDPGRVIIVESANDEDSLWSIEQVLKATNVVAVFAWVEQMDDHAIRRLQLAANEGAQCLVVFRPAPMRKQSSVAALRLELRVGRKGIDIDLFKVRAGRPVVLKDCVLLSPGRHDASG